MTPAECARADAWLLRDVLTDKALSRYDSLGGLAADATARPAATNELANALSIPFDQAAELLADALARRATNKLRS